MWRCYLDLNTFPIMHAIARDCAVIDGFGAFLTCHDDAMLYINARFVDSNSRQLVKPEMVSNG